MLVLTRKTSETIRIGKDIVLTVLRTKRGRVKLGIEPRSTCGCCVANWIGLRELLPVSTVSRSAIPLDGPGSPHMNSDNTNLKSGDSAELASADFRIRHEQETVSAGDCTNVLFFDGVCGLCNRSVDFLLSRDRRRTIRFAPLQGETARRVLGAEWRAANAVPQSFDTVVWRDHAGNEFMRSAAVVRVLWLIGGIWRAVGWLLWLIPRPLRDVGYRIVATTRYRLFGRHDSCRLPTPAERERFLP